MKIWWTNQVDSEAIGDMLPEAFPSYLRDQYDSRYGRNGRGRLWADSRFGDVTVSPWPDTPMGRILGETPRMGQTYAGIVIWEKDVLLLEDYPGVVTTMNLKRC